MIFYNKRIFKDCFRYKGKFFYKNFFQIPRYFKRVFFLMKNGWDCEAICNVDFWFADTMCDVLKSYLESAVGIDTEEFRMSINAMIDCLEYLKEDPFDGRKHFTTQDYVDIYDARKNIKDQFFKLLSSKFFNLWL